MGFARLAEQPVRALSGKSEKDKLSPMERIACSSIGGALGCWNQPIEVVRVEVSIANVCCLCLLWSRPLKAHVPFLLFL